MVSNLLTFQFVKHFICGTTRVFASLRKTAANAGHSVQLAGYFLIGLGIENDRLGFTVHGEHSGRPVFFMCFIRPDYSIVFALQKMPLKPVTIDAIASWELAMAQLTLAWTRTKSEYICYGCSRRQRSST